ncbi:MAG: hypothetical protein OK438_07730 [Thaumarchaeota archaeon]|nr:hypothetical protein [Nitrososphaerota archaeon]
MVPFFLLLDINEVELYESLNLVVALFAITLLAISLMAYRRTNLRRLLFVSVAFGFFAVQALIRELDELALVFGSGTEQVIIIILDLAILLFFFLALVVSK